MCAEIVPFKKPRSLTGLRNRTLIGVMIYTFARVGAVLGMKVGNHFSQGRRGDTASLAKYGKVGI